MASPQMRAYGLLALAMILAGSSIISGKYLVQSFPIFIAAELRIAIALLVLFPLAWYVDRGFGGLPLRTHLLLYGQSFTGLVMFNGFMLAGLERTTAATSGIITSLTPVLLVMLSRLFGDRFGRRTLLAAGIATLGLIVLNVAGGEEGTPSASELLGAFFVFMAVVGEAFYTIFGKMLVSRITAIKQTLWNTIYAFLTFLPLALLELPDWDISESKPSGWFAAAYAALLVTILSAWFWFKGLQSVPASRAGIFTGLIPVSAVLLAALLLNEAIGWPHLIGIVCVLIAIVLISSGNARDKSVAAELSPVPEHSVPTASTTK